MRSNYGGIMHLALEVVRGEDQPDQKLIKELNWIKNHTSEKLNTNYFVIVHTIARNMAKPLTAPIEVKVSERKTKEFELGELISELEEAHIRVNQLVREVAKKYSLDIMLGGGGAGIIQIPDIPMENK